MYAQIKNRNFYFILLTDLALFALAHLCAYLIRFDFEIPPSRWDQLKTVMPYAVGIKGVVFFGFNLYRGMWRYLSVDEVWRLFKAAALSSLLLIAAVIFYYRLGGFSRAVFLMDWAFTFIFCGGMRLGIRMFYQKRYFNLIGENGFMNMGRRKGKPILIIGAGDAGEKTLREIYDNPRLKYRIVGFIDDNPRKKGRSIHGVTVLGGVDDLAAQVRKRGVEEVFIAVPSAAGEEMRRIVDACEACGVRYKTLPGLGELLDGRVTVSALREVRYQDLLGRRPVDLNVSDIRKNLEGKTVLVTGAGGTIGAELCRQIVRFTPARLILLDASEMNLFSVQMELKHRISYLHYIPVLASVQDHVIMDRVFEKYRPEVVFHAAAYKHVPMIERNPWQAVFNNIMGAKCVTEHCIRHHVELYVLVSTDKAVKPANVMGASKRVCEMLMQAYVGNGTRMMAVRFGNVVGSSGSVIPLFRDQIARGGPVTVTHPEVTRYFMTISEAAKLILQAGAMGGEGEIFVLEMGTPVKIADMARDLIRLSGKEPDRDVKIAFTGLRPGEKLYEELITAEEGVVSTSHEKIMALKSNGGWGGLGSQEAFRSRLLTSLDALTELALRQDARGVKCKLRDIVPEYAVQETECVL